MSGWREALLAVPEARNRRVSVFLGGLMLFVGNLQIARVTYANFGPVTLFWVIVYLTAAGAGLVVWSFFRRGEIPVWQSAASELLTVFPIYWIIPVNQSMLIEAGLMKQPFQGLKLVMAVLAAIVPGPYLLQLFLVVSFAIEALVVWYVLDMGALPSLAGSGEPGFSLIFFLAMIVLILGRWRHDMLDRELNETKARARVLGAVAREFLRVRDQSGTPLQNLRLVHKLLESGKTNPAELHETLGRSLGKLEELNRGLNRYDHLVDWSGDPLTLDAEAEKLLAPAPAPPKKP